MDGQEALVDAIVGANERIDEVVKEVESLRKSNKELKDENLEMKYEIEDLKNKLNHVHFYFRFRMLTIDEFNMLTLDKQQDFIFQSMTTLDKDVEEKYIKHLNKIDYLILYLLDLDRPAKNTIALRINPRKERQPFMDLEEDQRIILLPTAVEILSKSRAFGTKELSIYLGDIPWTMIDIQYPSPTFKADYANLVKIKNSNEDKRKVLLSLVISGVKQTDNQFQNDKNISYVDICSSVTSIKCDGDQKGPFRDCTSLIQVDISPSVTEIGQYAFSGCSSLPSISIPSSVTLIGYEAFSFCSSLTQISIPYNVESIGKRAFTHCSSLRQISLPNSVKSIGKEAFRECISLRQISLPKFINEIEDSLFYNCKALTQVCIPSYVKSIGPQAFKDCTSLAQISLPSSLESIGEEAFLECTSLKQISLPLSTHEIGDNAFKKCTSLIYAQMPDRGSVGRNVFRACSSLTRISIPSSCPSRYFNFFQDNYSDVEVVKI